MEQQGKPLTIEELHRLYEEAMERVRRMETQNIKPPQSVGGCFFCRRIGGK